SLTVAPVTVLGPPLVTVIAYVTLVPGTSLVAPSVFTMERSACGVSGAVSVAPLLPGTGSVTLLGCETVAVLLRLPVRSAAMARVIWKLDAAPGASVPAVKCTVLVPVSYVAPPVAETNVVPAGNESLTVAPVTVLAPLLVKVIVY